MNRLHVDSVMKSFGNKQVLTDIFVSCEPGEIVGLIGRNGSGKSTLLKIIFGSLSADRKFVRIGNKVVNGLFDNRLLVNYLPQNSFLPNHIKVNTAIGLFCNNQKASQLTGHELIKPLLGKKVKQLSAGERRILEILLVCYSNAHFVLIDEPFNGVAPVHKAEIQAVIQDQAKHKGFVITDHDYQNVLAISTSNILLYDGGTKPINGEEDLQSWGYILG